MHGSLKPLGVRKVEIGDLPWLLSLADKRYRHFDPGTTLAWLAGIIQNPQALVSRTDDAFVIAIYTTPAWHPAEPECHVHFLCAAEGCHWQAMKLLRETVAWARGHGCVRWWFSSETQYEIGPLAKRLGARPRVMRYCLDLTDG